MNLTAQRGQKGRETFQRWYGRITASLRGLQPPRRKKERRPYGRLQITFATEREFGCRTRSSHGLLLMSSWW